MQAREHVVIVYQFGKVASTALVQSLNASAGVEAHQSHFLGDDALKRIVVNATGPGLTPYFREHMVGQLLANLELTYKMKCLQAGKDPRKLTVLSLAREPLAWFRSSLQQDIAGYQDGFAALGEGRPDDPRVVRQGVIAMLGILADAIERNGGADAAVHRIVAEGGRAFLEDTGVESEFVKTMLLLSLRPLTWFDDHFRKCFGHSLDAIPCQGRFWLKSGQPASFVVIRYEDIAEVFQPAMAAAGVPFKGPVVKANLSRNKPFAAEMRKAFESAPAARLGNALRHSDYGRRFGYARDARADCVAQLSASEVGGPQAHARRSK